jgi:hypothetical protein
MDHDLLHRPRDELAHDNQLRRELDAATPSIGAAGLIIGAVIVFILGVVYFSPPAGDRTHVASGGTVEAPATTAPSNP